MPKFGSAAGVLCFFGHLVRYRDFALTSTRVHRLRSFVNMIRVSSSASNYINGVFCMVNLEKLASKVDPGLVS